MRKFLERRRLRLLDREVRKVFRSAIEPRAVVGSGRPPRPLWPPVPPPPAPPWWNCPERAAGLREARRLWAHLPKQIASHSDAIAAYQGCMKMGPYYLRIAQAIAAQMITLKRIHEDERTVWRKRLEITSRSDVR